MADPALLAGAVALQPAVGASGAVFLAAGDEHSLWCEIFERLVRRAGHEPAVERQLARGDLKPFELGDRVREQRILAWVARRGRRRQDQPARAALGVLGHLRDWRIYLAAAPRALPALGRYGIKRFDRHTLLDERRYITRTLAGVYRVDATNEHGELLASGLRFTSRLPPAWECWALWEPPPLDEAGAQIKDVTFDTPALHTAADMLGVVLAQ